MARLKISDSTLKKLFALSGNCCAFPNCKEKCIDDSGNLIAQVCHIEAANPGGQRFNPNQNDEDRRDFSNLMVMCPVHHIATDNVEKYPTPLLKKMKADHEAKFKNKKDQFKVEKETLDKLSSQVNNFNFENNSGQQNVIQSGTQIIVNGNSTAETRQIVSDQIQVLAEELKKNLIHISAESQTIVDQRIQDFVINNLTPELLKLTSRIDDIEDKLKSPDIQYSFNQVLQAVGRRSSKSFNQSLANLMIARIESEDNSAEALIYNEAISVFPKLTSVQLGILAFAFLVHLVKFEGNLDTPEEIREWLDLRFGWIKKPQFAMSLNIKEIEFSHLEYTAVVSIGTESFDFDKSFVENTPSIKNILQKGNEENNKFLFSIRSIHDHTQIKNLRLNSVGIVLAIHWLKILTDLDFEAGLWLEV
jgi:hypothetical protein